MLAHEIGIRGMFLSIKAWPGREPICLQAHFELEAAAALADIGSVVPASFSGAEYLGSKWRLRRRILFSKNS